MDGERGMEDGDVGGMSGRERGIVMGGKCRKVEKNQETSNGKKQKVRLIERGETEQEEEERWEKCKVHRGTSE